MRFFIVLLLLSSLSILPSCDKDDDCSGPTVGLCPRETIVGTWVGTETVEGVQADRIVNAYNTQVEYRFSANGSVAVPRGGRIPVAEWYWFPDSAKLLIYQQPEPYMVIDSVVTSYAEITTKYQVNRCSDSELWLEYSIEAFPTDLNDRYDYDIRLEKQP